VHADATEGEVDSYLLVEGEFRHKWEAQFTPH